MAKLLQRKQHEIRKLIMQVDQRKEEKEDKEVLEKDKEINNKYFKWKAGDSKSERVDTCPHNCI